MQDADFFGKMQYGEDNSVPTEEIRSEAEHLLMEDFDRDNRVYRTLKFTDAELEEIEKVVSSPFLREWLYLGK